MTNATVEELFRVLDDTAIIIQNELEMSYLEAVYETGENLFQKEVLQKDELSAEATLNLEEWYSSVQLEEFAKEDIRKSYQLALLKGMKHGIQVNHQMTPDSIGFIMGYLVDKAFAGKKQIRLLDPACGTGNLIATIVNQLEGKLELDATGVDVDDLLISLAYVGADLERQPIQLLHQDGLGNLLVDPVDVVVSDLPVGYYPDDTRAKTFELSRDDGHSFAHFLFIEQGMRYTKAGGYLFFLVPSAMFGTADFAKVDRFIKKHGHIQGILQLPETLFASENARKSILILQKGADDIEPPKEVLLANLPSLTDPKATANILAKIENWFNENK